MVTTRLMTAEDLAQLPEDGNQYELIKGELIQLPPAGYEHGEVMFDVAWHFKTYARAHGGSVVGGDTGFRLDVDPDTVLAPDVAYVRAERIPPKDQRRGFPHLAPDVVVEVLSPSERPGYVRRKVAEYQAAGVALILLLDPRQETLLIHDRDGAETFLTSEDIFDGGEVMPGFKVPVREFFG